MITSQVTYEGELRTTAVHTLSGTSIITDAPPDNQGKGEAFSPTDLVATALASCMLTIMGIAARTHEMDIQGTRVEVTKIMASNPRRISEVHCHLFISGNFNDKQKAILEHAARTCPVIQSLSSDMIKVVTFSYA
ncbi:MAG TPA: OsmC family protein [Chitinophagales bacterium]|nr:OsmC family protein [Chitinophagales bacterium]HMZ89432.1 OsmC family protein [Chitinophagales bacterium]HNA57598.1 OsmC family protein [Chitinophagales bacterium]HNE45046.1 OsmC family protein [Chitinophagales bacterium]HNI53716.1 OsmC family protein [Chitinophagales bacterium]